MTVVKAILLTLLFIFIFSLFQLGFGFLFFETDLIPQYLQTHFGITILISFIISYLLLFKFFWKTNLNIKNTLNFKNYNFKIVIYLTVLVLGFQLLNKPLWDLERIWNYFKYSENATDYNAFNGFNLIYLYRLLAILIVSPVFEELFFRKFLLQKLVEKNNEKVAIIVSSLCFAIIHIETPLNLLPTFIFGIISSLIFIKTKKVGYVILLHFLYNLLDQMLYVSNVNYDNWLLSLNFNLSYWVLFLAGILITYFGTKKILAVPQ